MRPLHPRQFPAAAHHPADPQAVAAANKLATWPAATAPNQIWVGDITYLALATGHWAYLACWRDAFPRRVVGWQVSGSLHTDLILTAFERAVAICQPPPGLLVHADRGSQYTSDTFTQFLDRTQAIASLSRPGNPYDNARKQRCGRKVAPQKTDSYPAQSPVIPSQCILTARMRTPAPSQADAQKLEP
ncbi:DDE-type integrase/transposase/recombinase [Hymenobacter coccineus]|uniref:Integrase catalytic domain-containing protein n=1 Tax=Hymenobacter coccineus TaxID=1908235 RepID=A0A1G1TL78_9BACT|nr:DDE-type integrase/transposase/recombinase [Hymenobacter coccineus]OGX91613.1 hypothetical protein BEN49_04335 [Hymenobacter coccineus]